jgi:hypothetical protein
MKYETERIEVLVWDEKRVHDYYKMSESEVRINYEQNGDEINEYQSRYDIWKRIEGVGWIYTSEEEGRVRRKIWKECVCVCVCVSERERERDRERESGIEVRKEIKRERRIGNKEGW